MNLTDIHISVSEYGFKSLDEVPPATIFPVRVIGRDIGGHQLIIGIGEEACLWAGAAAACADAAGWLKTTTPKPSAAGTLWESVA
jgi:hypothetical protein